MDRPRLFVVSGATITNGNELPKVSGGPRTRAGLTLAGFPGCGSPKSTSQRSSIEAIGDFGLCRISQIVLPGGLILAKGLELGGNL